MEPASPGSGNRIRPVHEIFLALRFSRAPKHAIRRDPSSLFPARRRVWAGGQQFLPEGLTRHRRLREDRGCAEASDCLPDATWLSGSCHSASSVIWCRPQPEKGRTLKKLYVGNIPYATTEEELRAFFEQSGLQVASVTLIRDRMTGNPKGFGFVETNSEDEARTAIEKLNGQNFMGRNLIVNEARPPRDFGGGGGRGGRDSGGSSRRRY